MIRITQLKLSLDEPVEALSEEICRKLRIRPRSLIRWEVVRRSLDARRGRSFMFSYTVDAWVADEEACMKKLAGVKDLERRKEDPPILSERTRRQPRKPPIVVGFGPAGMFCALLLARAGLCPIVLERGRPVEERVQDVERFWREGVLDPDSNVQFGEGGAGTFSDGKLNTLVKDRDGIGRFILREFVRFGAPAEILYDAKPHIGTDRLRSVVRALRQEILSLGGQIHFSTCLSGIEQSPEGWKIFCNGESTSSFVTDAVFLAIGHSARDTFAMLEKAGVAMEPKPFAVGFRIEHPQQWVDQVQYREYAGHPALGPAPYKVTGKGMNGRGVYSFCMCPGGLVVAAASEEGRLVTNGMSNYLRDEANANAAILVGVTPKDYEGYAKGPLSGVAFQRDLERRAYELGGGRGCAPVEDTADFLKGLGLTPPETHFLTGSVRPSYTMGVREADLTKILPEELGQSIGLGLLSFQRSMGGFAEKGGVLTGVESRSSSPVRILRDESMQSGLPGLYPLGEGAGYAGGIMSAAMDGLKAARMYLASLEVESCGV